MLKEDRYFFCKIIEYLNKYEEIFFDYLEYILRGNFYRCIIGSENKYKRLYTYN